MNYKRILKHLFYFINSDLKIHFSKTAISNIEREIKSSEKLHQSEFCVIIESSLSIFSVFKGITPRERAIYLFSDYHIWDTEMNSGILLYILLADRSIEIVADRGISRLAKGSKFKEISFEIEKKFKDQKFEEGVLWGIRSLTTLIVKHFPSKKKSKKNEISNKPILI